ncbi:hypothetical protein MLD38_031465 [Melastoma candidum]|uniref:Uncharacterized protein n=1 Tax=Melastoma candidum TaxID=119954 RepID=A0ACB9MPT4_9MYRT|nr:hypothetical protein MLD38_031465 [Melastoma candidum]
MGDPPLPISSIHIKPPLISPFKDQTTLLFPQMGKYFGALFFVLSLISGGRGLSFLHSNSTSSDCNAHEHKALLEFKDALSPINWDLMPERAYPILAWNGTRCCGWSGISCDDKGRVMKLEALGEGQDAASTTYDANTSLIEVFRPLLKLRYLNHLDLTGIYCSGCMIPPLLGSMEELLFVGLPVGLSGNIPPSLGNLTRLQALVVPSSYGLSLASTNVGWLSRLTSLARLELNFGGITEAVDMAQVLNWLPSLKHLALASCSLDNSFLRHGISNATLAAGLSHLDMSYNFFSGTIPEVLKNLTSLEVLDMSGNSFNSSIPAWFVNFRNMVGLFLESNSLASIDGGLGWLLGSKRNLRSINLSFNMLNQEVFENGSMPMSSLHGQNLEHLDLSNNMLDGLPDWLGNLKTLKHLDLSNNMLDSLPDWLGNLKTLKTLWLQRNYLSGDVLGWLSELPSLEWLDLSENQLSGSIPSSIGTLKSLRVLDLHENGLNGTVAEALGQLSYLESLDLSHNSLKGVISEAHFRDLSKLNFLDLSDNHLTVGLDNLWMPPFQLRTIRMRSCVVGKRFPQWVRTQEEAQELDLSDASISDAFPEWIEKMKISHLNVS